MGWLRGWEAPAREETDPSGSAVLSPWVGFLALFGLTLLVALSLLVVL